MNFTSIPSTRENYFDSPRQNIRTRKAEHYIQGLPNSHHKGEYRSCLYIMPSFPGTYILSGRIILNSQHRSVKSEYSHIVNEFNINSQHTMNLLEMIRFSVNLLQIHFCSQNQNNKSQLSIYRTQLSGPPYSVGENRLKFPSHICKK